MGKKPIYDTYFGWGKPVYMGLGEVLGPGNVYVLPCATNDGSLLCAISMPEKQMRAFEKLFFDILIWMELYVTVFRDMTLSYVPYYQNLLHADAWMYNGYLYE